MNTIPVNFGPRSYSVRVGNGLLDQLGPIAREKLASTARAFLVVDSALPETTIERASRSLKGSGFDVSVTTLHATEPEKSLATLERLLVALARTRHERRDPVVALGGGIVGDVAGFAASVYRRGVPVVQCPTTLLSMVDASVGGKTGVNLSTGTSGVEGASIKKNLVGAFHQPTAVVADIGTLRSLPARHFRSGLAECIKHGMIGAIAGDPGLFDWIDANLDAILAQDSRTLIELVSRNVKIKAAIVAGDEREESESAAGGRALLNLGHTFGHAFEPIATLSPDGNPANTPLQHGEAVALGLLAAARCSEMLGEGSASLKSDTLELLMSRAKLPTRVAGLPPTESIVASMMHDKKVQGGKLRLVLPNKGFSARVVDDPAMAPVRNAIDSLRA